jgi:hypothetical protein
MSKKSRRLRTPNLPPEAYNVPSAAAPAAAARADVEAPSAPTVQQLNLMDEYKDVIRDLRRTFIIFAGLVAVMLVGSFLLR